MTDPHAAELELDDPIGMANIGHCAYCARPLREQAAFYLVAVALHHVLPPNIAHETLTAALGHTVAGIRAHESSPLHHATRLVCESCGQGRKIIAMLLEERP